MQRVGSLRHKIAGVATPRNNQQSSTSRWRTLAQGGDPGLVSASLPRPGPARHLGTHRHHDGPATAGSPAGLRLQTQHTLPVTSSSGGEINLSDRLTRFFLIITKLTVK